MSFEPKKPGEVYTNPTGDGRRVLTEQGTEIGEWWSAGEDAWLDWTELSDDTTYVEGCYVWVGAAVEPDETKRRARLPLNWIFVDG